MYAAHSLDNDNFLAQALRRVPAAMPDQIHEIRMFGALEDMPAGRTAYAVAPGELMSVVVDTSPEVRAAMGTPPVIPGRAITLQKRVDGNRWSTIGSGTADAAGVATFTVSAPQTGDIVLRAREERWTAGGNEIGWFPSFPTYFTVDPLDRRAHACGSRWISFSPVRLCAKRGTLRERHVRDCSATSGQDAPCWRQCCAGM